MLSAEQILGVRLLLKLGVGNRAVARELGINRITVHSVAADVRPCYARVLARRYQKHEDDQPVYCPGCGALRRLPCVICAARAARDVRLKRARAALARAHGGVLHEPTDEPGLDLRGEDRQRLEEVSTAHRAASAPRLKLATWLDRSTTQYALPEAVFIADDDEADTA